VVTRPEPENSQTCAEIRALGSKAGLPTLEPIAFPCIKIRPLPPDEWAPSWRGALAACTWLAFTSPRGVDSFFDGLRTTPEYAVEQTAGSDFFAGKKFAATGPTTAEALARRGCTFACMPALFNGAELGKTLAAQAAPGEDVLLIRPRHSEDGLSSILRQKNIPLWELAVYETLPTEGSPAVRSIIEQGNFDMVLFASPSAVSAFADVFASALNYAQVRALCIGDSTAAMARKFGMAVHVAREASMAGLYRLVGELTQGLSNQ
jgi:uroporphyrinogen III methyltransferase/synthase